MSWPDVSATIHHQLECAIKLGDFEALLGDNQLHLGLQQLCEPQVQRGMPMLVLGSLCVLPEGSPLRVLCEVATWANGTEARRLLASLTARSEEQEQ